MILQVWQYYLLPDEEQRMPGRKNPMCNTFPRIGDHDDDDNSNDVDDNDGDDKDANDDIENDDEVNGDAISHNRWNLEHQFWLWFTILFDPASCNYWRWGSAGGHDAAAAADADADADADDNYISWSSLLQLLALG